MPDETNVELATVAGRTVSLGDTFRDGNDVWEIESIVHYDHMGDRGIEIELENAETGDVNRLTPAKLTHAVENEAVEIES